MKLKCLHVPYIPCPGAFYSRKVHPTCPVKSELGASIGICCLLVVGNDTAGRTLRGGTAAALMMTAHPTKAAHPNTLYLIKHPPTGHTTPNKPSWVLWVIYRQQYKRFSRENLPTSLQPIQPSLVTTTGRTARPGDLRQHSPAHNNSSGGLVNRLCWSPLSHGRHHHIHLLIAEPLGHEA